MSVAVGGIRRDDARPSMRDPDPKPIRVLVFMDTSTVSGPLRQLMASLDDLRRDHAVTPQLVVCTRRGKDVRAMHRYLAESGHEVVLLEERSRFDWRVLIRYRELLRAPSVHCVQSHGYKPTIYLAILRWFTRRRPWIAFFHGRTYETRAVQLFDRLAMSCARWADRIVVVAASQQRLFAGRRTVRHIPNAVTVRPVAPSPMLSQAQDDPPLLLFVGRLSPEKGVDVLIRALPELKRRYPSVRLRLVGDGPSRDGIRQLVEALGMTAHVDLVGHVEDTVPHYAAARLLCLPSRSEGMPNVVLEAIAAGLPVVASDVGDVQTLVGTELGRVVPPDDVGALAQALGDELDHQRGQAFLFAREQLLRRFDRTTRAQALRALYDELVATP